MSKVNSAQSIEQDEGNRVASFDDRAPAPEENLGSRIRLARENQGWKLAELAERTGLTKTTVYRYERGETWPGAPELRKLSDTLKVSLQYLIYGTDKFEGERSLGAELLDIDDDTLRTIRLTVALSVLTCDERAAVARLVASIVEARLGKNGYRKMMGTASEVVSSIMGVFDAPDMKDKAEEFGEALVEDLEEKLAQKGLLVDDTSKPDS